MSTKPAVRVGGSGAYTTMWEWHLEGTNHEIGRDLATWGRDQLGAAPLPCPDERRIASQRRFFQRFYPPHYQRMRGVAEAFGLSIDEGSSDVSSLWFDIGLPGCTAAFVPGARMETGGPHVLRNMDFGIDLSPQAAVRPASRLVVLGLRPDEGYESLGIVVFDLLGAMDGINEKGLVVVCNAHADYRLDPAYRFERVEHPEAGLNELQVVRCLLDLCSDVKEAKDALLSLRWYYGYTPCLYLVADVQGRAFVCEKSPSGNRIRFTERDGEPLVMTNFGLTRFPTDAALPTDDGPDKGFAYTRYRLVNAALAPCDGPLGTEELASIAARASFDALSGPKRDGNEHPDRTIWTSLYDIEARRMLVSCYLSEEDRTNRSEFVEIALDTTP